MKKKIRIVLVLACLLALAAGLAACGKKYSSMEEWLESAEGKLTIKIAAKDLDDSMKLTVTGDGNRLIYTYQLMDYENQPGLAEAFQSAMAEEAETFRKSAREMKGVVDVDVPIVTVTYLDKNGVLIYTEDFPGL